MQRACTERELNSGVATKDSTDGGWVGGGARTGQMWRQGTCDLALNHERGRKSFK